MNTKSTALGLSLLLIAVLMTSILVAYIHQNERLNTIVEKGRSYSLVHPVFAESMATTPTFLDEEAGISLYVNIGRSIDLAVAKTVFRALEKETTDYIVGSVNVSLSENEDVHCFVHKEGWIVTYYGKGEPVSKIVDWSLWSQSTSKLTKNKLQVGLEKMTYILGVPPSSLSVSYYHFQYPNANKCMIILETLVGKGEDSFNVTIPNDLTVYERSWSHYAECTSGYWGADFHSYFKIDGNTIESISDRRDSVTERGTLIVAQLIQGAAHIVSVSSDFSESDLFLYGVCIGLVYQEP
jgi:hypothetical protein